MRSVSTRCFLSGELLDLQHRASKIGRGRDTSGLHACDRREDARLMNRLALGVSPRGAQALYRATQAFAMVEGRDYVIPDDVKRLVIPVFAQPDSNQRSRPPWPNAAPRLSERILQEILTLVEVPL